MNPTRPVGGPAGVLDARRAAAAVMNSKREDDFVAWRSETPHDSATGPVLAEGGHVFLTDGKNLVRVNPDGNRAWARPLANWTHHQPAARPDGGAICAAQGKGLTSFNPDGTESWTWGQDMEIQSIAPAVGQDGSVYVCAKTKEPRKNHLVALNPDGTQRWSVPLSMHSSAPPVLHEDGRVSLRLDDNKIVSVDADGTFLWEEEIRNEWVQSRPTAGPDGSVWVGARSGRIFKVSPQGKSEEFFEAVGEIRGAPKVYDGKLYFTTMKGMVYCVDGGGKEVWRRSLGGILETPVTQMADGSLIVASFEKQATVLNPNGTVKWQAPIPVPGDDEIPVDASGTAYFAGSENLVAVNPAGPRVDLEKMAPTIPAGDIEIGGDWVQVGNILLPMNSTAGT